MEGWENSEDHGRANGERASDRGRAGQKPLVGRQASRTVPVGVGLSVSILPDSNRSPTAYLFAAASTAAVKV